MAPDGFEIQKDELMLSGGLGKDCIGPRMPFELLWGWGPEVWRVSGRVSGRYTVRRPAAAGVGTPSGLSWSQSWRNFFNFMAQRLLQVVTLGPLTAEPTEFGGVGEAGLDLRRLVFRCKTAVRKGGFDSVAEG